MRSEAHKNCYMFYTAAGHKTVKSLITAKGTEGYRGCLQQRSIAAALPIGNLVAEDAEDRPLPGMDLFRDLCLALRALLAHWQRRQYCVAQHLGLAILLPVHLLHMTTPVSTAAMTAGCPDSHHILYLSLPGSLGSTCNVIGPAVQCNTAPCTAGHTLQVAIRHFWRCSNQHAWLLEMHIFVAVSAYNCNVPWPYSLGGAIACCAQPRGA